MKIYAITSEKCVTERPEALIEEVLGVIIEALSEVDHTLDKNGWRTFSQDPFGSAKDEQFCAFDIALDETNSSRDRFIQRSYVA